MNEITDNSPQSHVEVLSSHPCERDDFLLLLEILGIPYRRDSQNRQLRAGGENSPHFNYDIIPVLVSYPERRAYLAPLEDLLKKTNEKLSEKIKITENHSPQGEELGALLVDIPEAHYKSIVHALLKSAIHERRDFIVEQLRAVVHHQLENTVFAPAVLTYKVIHDFAAREDRKYIADGIAPDGKGSHVAGLEKPSGTPGRAA
jgi:hypothetical protein